MPVDPSLLAIWVGAAGSVVLAVTDLIWRRIPNAVVYPLLLLIPVFLIWRWLGTGSPVAAIDMALGFVVIGGMWLAVFMLGGCGGGDVKLMAANGGLLGLALGLMHLMLSLVAAIAYLIVIVAVRLLAAYMPGKAWIGRFIASHWRTQPQGVGADVAGSKRGTIAIPFALPVALGYIPLLVEPLPITVLSWF